MKYTYNRWRLSDFILSTFLANIWSTHKNTERKGPKVCYVYYAKLIKEIVNISAKILKTVIKIDSLNSLFIRHKNDFLS